MKLLALALAMILVVGYPTFVSAQAQTPSAQEIMGSVRLATGGNAWSQSSERESEGAFEVEGHTGSFHSVENLRTGENVRRVQIPDAGVNQSRGTTVAQSWQREDAGDIQLQPGTTPSQIDELYLTSHGYWRPNFGGAQVKVLEPATEGVATWDRLQFRVPNGNGFTLWINRSTHLIERIVGDPIVYLSDYRPVQGVLLPFSLHIDVGGQQQIITLTRQTLSERLDAKGFAIPFRKDYTMPPSGSVTVPAEQGTIFAAKINGKGPFKVMFDTGSVDLMSADLAKYLGLRLEGKVRLASDAGLIDGQTAHIDMLQIGDLVLRDQTFLVINSSWNTKDPLVGAVGYELMRRLTVKVDYEAQQLTFYDAPSFTYSGSGIAVPLLLHGTTFEVQGRLAGVNGTFALDTGNQFGFSLESAFVKENDVIKLLGARFQGYSGRSYAGPLPVAYYARVKTLHVGDAEVNNVIAYLNTGEPGPADYAGNIGDSILRQFNVTFDAMHGTLFLEKNANWGKPGVFNRAGIVLDIEDHGQLIKTILPGSSGETAGLLVGDLITAIDGHSPGDDSNEPAFLQPVGTVVHLTVRRGESNRDFDVTLRDVL